VQDQDNEDSAEVHRKASHLGECFRYLLQGIDFSCRSAEWRNGTVGTAWNERSANRTGAYRGT
jgi:hypothetical protein